MQTLQTFAQFFWLRYTKNTFKKLLKAKSNILSRAFVFIFSVIKISLLNIFIIFIFNFLIKFRIN